MKVLYYPLIQQQAISSRQAGDYLTDTLFHGLRSLLGEDLIDGYRMWHVYNDAHPESLSHLWGKGFTTYGLLPNIKIDRDDIGGKIQSRYFDYVICPMHHTMVQDWNTAKGIIKKVLEFYPANRVCLIDGWDRPYTDTSLISLVPFFKREINEETSQAKPISFSIPKEKLRPLGGKRKQIDFAPLVPAYGHFDDPHMKSYIYDNEKDYYDMYEESHFAYTCKKGREHVLEESWDCMRHYEILAAGSVPYFTDIEKCPPKSMFRFPKDLCIKAKKMSGVIPGTKKPFDPEEDTFIGTSKAIKDGSARGYIDYANFNNTEYENLLGDFREYTEKYLTTESMAKYLLEEMKKCSE